jgi:hypothetical protein
MNPMYFLRIGGLLSLGIGLFGIFQPEGIGPALWFDVTENIVHTTFGLLLLAAGFLDQLQALRTPVTLFTGVISFIIGIAGLFVTGINPPNFLGITNLEHPVDNILHIGFGLWALLCLVLAKNREGQMKLT